MSFWFVPDLSPLQSGAQNGDRSALDKLYQGDPKFVIYKIRKRLLVILMEHFFFYLGISKDIFIRRSRLRLPNFCPATKWRPTWGSIFLL